MRFNTGLAVLALAATASAGDVRAQPAPDGQQKYPSRPVQLVVPFPAGGTVDILGRTLAADLSRRWNQQVVVVNRPGAGGNIGVDMVAKANPDGYNLVLGTSSTHVVNPFLFAHMPFDPRKDFAPVCLLASVSNVLVVNDSVRAGSVKELIALAKRSPGQLSYASFGVGTSPHLAGALFSSVAGIQITHVPYKGGPPALNDLLGNQVQMMFSNTPVALPFIESGRLKALGVTSQNRLPELPNVPTMAEAGLPGFEVEQLFALFAPANTPAPILAALNDAVNAALKVKSVRTTLEGQGFRVIGGSAEELAQILSKESVKWEKVIKESGARAE